MIYLRKYNFPSFIPDKYEILIPVTYALNGYYLIKSILKKEFGTSGVSKEIIDSRITKFFKYCERSQCFSYNFNYNPFTKITNEETVAKKLSGEITYLYPRITKIERTKPEKEYKINLDGDKILKRLAELDIERNCKNCFSEPKIFSGIRSYIQDKLILDYQ